MIFVLRASEGDRKVVNLLKTLVFVSLLGLASCTVAEIGRFAAEEAYRQINNATAKDTLLVRFNPVYFKVDLSDTADYERDMDLYGYRVWLLRAGSVLRIEVQKLDTVVVK